MKNKILVSTILLALFLFPLSIFGADTGWKSPTGNASDCPSISTDFSDGANAYLSNDTYATRILKSAQYPSHSYCSFDFDITADATIDGIEVLTEHFGEDIAIDEVVLYLRINSTAKGEKTISCATDEGTQIVGGATDLWNTTWTDIDFANDNFSIIVMPQSNSETLYTYSLDNTQIKIYYTSPAEPLGVITAGFEDYTMSSTTAYIGDLWSSAGVYLYLFIGIPLGFWIIKRVIDEAKIRKVKGRKSD